MSILRLDRSDLKLFLGLLVLANSPPLILYSKIPVVSVLMLLPALFWVNIPGVPLALIIGKPHFELKEFGAMPMDPLSWALIISFWVVLPYAVTLIVKKVRQGAR